MTEMLQQPYIHALAWTLVHFVWQGAALGLVAFLWLRRARLSATTRYMVGIATLAAMLAAPVATFVALQSREFVGAGFGRPDPAPAEVGSYGTPRSAPSVSESKTPLEPTVLSAVLAGWLIGVVALSVRLAGGWIVARRYARRAILPVSPEVHALARRIAGRLALERVVRVFESSAVTVPMMVGWMKPIVLLPAAALSGLTPTQIEALLAHELAHVRRHDYLVNLLQAAVETLLFYHPAVWWVSRQVRCEREHCCDDLAIGICGDRLLYATALADLAAMTTPRLVLAASDGSLLNRVRRILRGRDQHQMPSGWLGAGFAALLLTALIPSGFVLANPQNGSSLPGTVDRRVDTADQAGAPEGVPGGVRVGVPGGVAGGIAEGMPGGVAGGVPGEVSGGVSRGVSDGVLGGVRDGVSGGVLGGVQEAEQRRRLEEDLAKLEARLKELRAAREEQVERQRAEIESAPRELAQKMETDVELKRSKIEELNRNQAERKMKMSEDQLRELDEKFKRSVAEELRLKGLKDFDKFPNEDLLKKQFMEIEKSKDFTNKLEEFAKMKDAAGREKAEKLEKIEFDKLWSERMRALEEERSANRPPADYQFKTADVVEVEVIGGEDRLSVARRRVADDGTITLPFVGVVKIGGSTVEQAERSLQQRFTSGGFTAVGSVNIRLVVR